MSDDNIIDFGLEKITREVAGAEITMVTEDGISDLGKTLGDIIPPNAIKIGILEAMERAKAYDNMDKLRTKRLVENGFNPYLCYNLVCEENDDRICERGDGCHSCLFQMPTPPPNSLDYTANEKEAGVRYMPSHREALQMLVDNNLLKDEVFERMIETKFYRDDCKASTQYDRENVKIKEVTFGQLRGAIKHALHELYCDHTTISGGFDFSPSCPDFDLSEEGDQEVFSRNLCLTVEKVMGIYPNIKLLDR